MDSVYIVVSKTSKQTHLWRYFTAFISFQQKSIILLQYEYNVLFIPIKRYSLFCRFTEVVTVVAVVLLATSNRDIYESHTLDLNYSRKKYLHMSQSLNPIDFIKNSWNNSNGPKYKIYFLNIRFFDVLLTICRMMRIQLNKKCIAFCWCFMTYFKAHKLHANWQWYW